MKTTSVHEQGKKKKHSFKELVVTNLQIIFILTSIVLGVLIGLGLRSLWSYEDYTNIYFLELPGRILLNILKVLILPLIVTGLVTAINSIEIQSGRIGAVAVLYYVSTTVIAAVTGMVLVVLVHPGIHNTTEHGHELISAPSSVFLKSLLDIISQCFPENLVTACFQKEVTELVKVPSYPRLNKTSNSTYTVKLTKPFVTVSPGTNVIGLVVFSMFLGLVINYLGEEGQPLKAFFKASYLAVMVMAKAAIWYTPVGVMCLIAARLIGAPDIAHDFAALGKFMGVVVAGLLIHAVILSIMYWAFTKKNPLMFAFMVNKTLYTAFSTSSSLATLPVTVECLVQNNDININIVKFVAPVGATINMDGTALYETMACIFIAQISGMHIGLTELIIISFTATAGAVGTSGVPQAGLGTLVIVLTSMGISLDNAVILLSVDWILDRCRTVVNVWGVCVGAGILDHFFKNTQDLAKLNEMGYKKRESKNIDETA